MGTEWEWNMKDKVWHKNMRIREEPHIFLGWKVDISKIMCLNVPVSKFCSSGISLASLKTIIYFF